MKKYLPAMVAAFLVAGVVLANVIVTGQAVNTSAPNAAVNAQLCVWTNDAGGPAYTVPVYTRSFELQNDGPNSVYCTLDGQAPVVSSLGRRIAGLVASETSASDAWAVDCTNTACNQIRCVAKTADQADGGCIQLTLVK